MNFNDMKELEMQLAEFSKGKEEYMSITRNEALVLAKCLNVITDNKNSKLLIEGILK